MWDARENPVRLKGDNGILLTQKLFVEFGDEQSPYTLKAQDVEKDGTTYVSLYRVYMESADEYEAAMRLLGSMKHWRKLCGLKWFQEGWEEHGFDGLNLMREDMLNRDRSSAKKELLKAAAIGNVSAMKILYDQSAVKKPTKQTRTVNSTGVEQDLIASFAVLDGGRR